MRPRLPWLPGLLLVALVSCGGRPFAEGSSRELTVITSLPPDAPEILLLRAVVERTAVRIDDEKAYVVRIVPPGDGVAYRARNVVVVGFGPGRDVPGPARRLHRLLGRDQHAAGEPFAFTPDVWLRGQAAGIVWTATREEWIPAVTKAQNRLFQALDRATFAGVRERVLSLPRDAKVEGELRDALGISMRVPRGMGLTLDRPGRAALLLDEGPPARLLRIAVGATNPNADAWHAREALAKRFRPDEVTLDVAEPLLSPDVMAGATRQLHGRWQDSAVSAAGPYRYYEVTRGTLRLQIDLAVFAPGTPKLPYLRELHAIAETIAPAH
ncbi:MAG TPA: hypothetical protein VFS09_01510 [Candidatus Eisenbacteria bacterium]|nr:hypothetical protein [Candidatus Eisenbacteria bacterium]